MIRFRTGQYAIVGDIEQMFHQIKVPQHDSDALRFVWRENTNLPINEYMMTVHVFGKVDSPCCANWILKKAANDQQHIHDKRTINAILDRFYMDDYLDSFDYRI